MEIEKTTLLGYAKKTAIFVAGASIMLAGIALLPLPGPGFIVIALGLGVLALEFEWARRLLKRLKAKLKDTATRFKQLKHDRSERRAQRKKAAAPLAHYPVGEKARGSAGQRVRGSEAQ